MKNFVTGGLLSVFLLLSTAMPAAASYSDLILGMGSGPTYGYNGINLEYPVAEYFALTAGLGQNKAGMAWLAGGRIYLLDQSVKVRPRLGVYYGSALDSYYGARKRHYENINGRLFGLGMDIRIASRMHLDPEVVYGFDKEKDWHFWLCIGVRW